MKTISINLVILSKLEKSSFPYFIEEIGWKKEKQVRGCTQGTRKRRDDLHRPLHYIHSFISATNFVLLEII